MNHIEWTEHKIMALNLQIGTKLLDNHSYPRFPSSFISLSSKSYENIIFSGAEHNELQRRDSHSNIYLLLNLLWCQKSIS